MADGRWRGGGQKDRFHEHGLSRGLQRCRLPESWLAAGGAFHPERQYVRDPSGGIVTGNGHPFDATAQLPESARFSGYRRGDAELWVGSDADEFVYLVFDDHAERWPRTFDPSSVGCE